MINYILNKKVKTPKTFLKNFIYMLKISYDLSFYYNVFKGFNVGNNVFYLGVFLGVLEKTFFGFLLQFIGSFFSFKNGQFLQFEKHYLLFLYSYSSKCLKIFKMFCGLYKIVFSIF